MMINESLSSDSPAFAAFEQEPSATEPAWRFWAAACLHGLAAYLITGVVVALGLVVGITSVDPASHLRTPRHVPPVGNLYWDALTQWDGQWFIEIAGEGYTYDPHAMSRVAFFPLYPLLAAAVRWITGLPADASLLVVSHGFLIGTFILLFAYARRRYPAASRSLGFYALLALGLVPTAFFMRMLYTESLFLFLCLLAFYGMQRRWPVLWVAIVVGLATASRSVGVALIPPLVLYVWSTSPLPLQRWRRTLGTMLGAILLGSSGLLLYMAFLGAAFHEPLAFAKTQRHWDTRRPCAGIEEKLLVYASLEPIWTVYDPSSPAYWKLHGENRGALFHLPFVNPILFVLTTLLVLYGIWRNWLTNGEILLAFGLLAIPYVMASYEVCMRSHGRYASVVFPAYLVLANMLSRMSSAWALSLVALLAAYLGIFTAMWAAGYLLV